MKRPILTNGIYAIPYSCLISVVCGRLIKSDGRAPWVVTEESRIQNLSLFPTTADAVPTLAYIITIPTLLGNLLLQCQYALAGPRCSLRLAEHQTGDVLPALSGLAEENHPGFHHSLC